MAYSRGSYGGTYGSSFQLELEVILQSQNIVNNTSTVKIIGRFKRISTTGGRIHNFDATPWSANVDGQSYSGSFAYDSYANINTLNTFLDTTKTISHNADGTKAISFSVSHNANNSPYLTSASASASLDLAVIPRATQPTVSSTKVEIGSAVTITMPRASSSFTHKLWYQINSESLRVIGTGFGTSYTWTIPNSVMESIPASETANINIVCETVNGSTTIGSSKSIATPIIARVPTEVKPSFSSISHSEANSSVASIVGLYVQSLSKLNIAIVGATGAYGSTIKAYKITIEDQVLNAASGVTKFISNSGTLTITGTVTDSRNRIFSKSVNISVLSYSFPKFNSLSMFRCTSDGTRDELGTYVKVQLNCEVTSLINSTQKNSLAYKVLVKKTSSSTYETMVDTTHSSITYNNSMKLSNFPIDYSYDVQVQVRDKFNTSISLAAVGTGVITMQLGDDWLSVGKLYGGSGSIDTNDQIFQNNGQRVIDDSEVSELVTNSTIARRSSNGFLRASYFNSSRGNESTAAESYLYDTGDGYIRKKTKANAANELVIASTNMPDWVVEQGNNYRKWNSGRLEQWGSVSATTVFNQAWGSMYYYTAALGNFPLSFISAPEIVYSMRSGTYLFVEAGYNYATASTIGIARLIHTSNNWAGVSINVSYRAVGRWK